MSSFDNKIIVSVVICTYNRSEMLKICLESLFSKEIYKDNFEVLVVDNNSSDDTKNIVDNLKKDFNIRYIFEKIQGLSYARNCGWKNALGEYVAFIDDDAKADQEWLNEIFKFIENNPNVSVFGGPYDRFSLKEFPDWFPVDYGKNYLTGDIIRKIDLKKECLSGTNMVFKKEVLYLMNGFVNFLGMSGDRIGYGEETELLNRVYKIHIPIYYNGYMVVSHLVADYKMSLGWLLNSSYSSGKSSVFIFKNKNFIYCFFAFLFGLLTSILRFLNPKKMFFKMRLYYSFNHFFYRFGALIGSLSINKNKL